MMKIWKVHSGNTDFFIQADTIEAALAKFNSKSRPETGNVTKIEFVGEAE